MMPAEIAKHTAPAARWLSIVGIGEDGVAGLGEEARELIRSADFVFGGKRHLALVAELATGEQRPWPTPFDTAMSEVRSLRGRNICVLASGDPFLHGVGATLSHHVGADEMNVIPAPSAFSLAASRLGWTLQDTETVSLHGRPVELVRPLLHPGCRVLALTSDENGPAALARLLSESGFGTSRITVLEALGGPKERVRATRAAAFAFSDIAPLNVVAVEVEAGADARVMPLTPGLPDDFFEHDGQITKQEVRALTLAALAPRRGELLWDIGAGAGSVSIEWMLCDASLKAIAIEANVERAARIARNAAALGVPGLEIVEGAAPEALAELDTPQAIFIGGGGSKHDVLDAALEALAPGGRLVANAVTLEMEALLLERRAALGGSLTRLAVSRAEPVGTMTGWRPAMPVTQWTWRKP